MKYDEINKKCFVLNFDIKNFIITPPESICIHSLVLDGRRLSVVLGSSTLHNLWRVEQYRPNYHIDFDTIIGGFSNVGY